MSIKPRCLHFFPLTLIMKDTHLGQVVKKHACGGFFDEFAPFAYEPLARRAANGDRNPLLRKGSETTAHVAGFGLAIGGLRPSNTSLGFSTV